MLKITIGKKSYNLPENWDEIKLNQLINISNIENDNMNSDILKAIKTLGLLADEEGFEKDIKKLNYSDIELLFLEFDWIKVEPKFDEVEEKEFLEIDGNKYKIKKDYDKLSVDEVVAIEELTKSKKIDLNQIEIVFGVLFRKLKEDGTEEEFTMDLLFETIKSLKHKVYIKDIWATINFFLSGEKKSSKTSPSYSLMKITKVKNKSNMKKKTKKKKKA